MGGHWSFGQKVAAGFALTVALAVVLGVIGIVALRGVVASKDRVIDVQAEAAVELGRMATVSARRSAAARGYLIDPQPESLQEFRDLTAELAALQRSIETHLDSAVSLRLFGDYRRAAVAHQEALESIIDLRNSGVPVETVTRQFASDVGPAQQDQMAAMDALAVQLNADRDAGRDAASDTASGAALLLIVVTVAVVLCAGVAAFFVTRALNRQIGAAVAHVRSSSSELQTAANQQAGGIRQQATAMSEITTTLNELLATSRQIADSAQRVAQVAEQTAGAARAGETTVDQGHDSITGIRRQVDLIIGHMLELGKKSQQIGTVLDIVAELAEQTNILAINAMIEAAGAGEFGRRFAVVADEIRKLADRVTGSAGEIRTLIEDVRSAVNTTVMMTETGSKAVDVGARQFNEVTVSFKRIVGLVQTTTEAAREIQLSTKQQTTAVEQVHLAIGNVAQSAQETEASSRQTLQTASQLASLSSELLRLVRADAAA